MPPASSSEEIIEKKSSAPMAVAALVVATLALVGACAFNIAEIAEYRRGSVLADAKPGMAYARKASTDFAKKVDEVIQKNAGGPVDATTTPDADKPAADENAAGKKPAADKADAEPEEKAGDKAEEKADTKADDAAAGGDKADEKPADEEK